MRALLLFVCEMARCAHAESVCARTFPLRSHGHVFIAQVVVSADGVRVQSANPAATVSVSLFAVLSWPLCDPPSELQLCFCFRCCNQIHLVLDGQLAVTRAAGFTLKGVVLARTSEYPCNEPFGYCPNSEQD